MSAVLSYLSSIRIELLKLKGTFAFWLTIISAFFIPTLYFLIYLFKTEAFIPKDGVNPWDRFLFEQIRNVIPFLLPLYIILVTSLIMQIEHKSNGLKHLFALPIPKWSIYFSKLTIVVLSILFTYILFYTLMIGSGFLVGFISPQTQLADFEPKYIDSLKILFRSFLAILGIVGFQFWFSFRSKNFIIPLAVGVVFMITGLVVYSGDEAIYFPYSYHMISLFAANKSASELLWIPNIGIYSILYFVLFSIVGFIDVRSRNVK